MKTSKKLVMIFFALASFFLNSFVYGQTVTERLVNIRDGAEMVQICAREGAANIVDDFDRRGWDALKERAATGDPDWLDASACLAHGLKFFVDKEYNPNKENLGDYGVAVLIDAWQEVLLRNPEKILGFGDKIPLGWVCGYPYEAAWDYNTVELVDEFLNKMLAALEKVDDEELQLNKKICELYLKDAHEGFREDLANRHKRG